MTSSDRVLVPFPSRQLPRAHCRLVNTQGRTGEVIPFRSTAPQFGWCGFVLVPLNAEAALLLADYLARCVEFARHVSTLPAQVVPWNAGRPTFFGGPDAA